MSSFPICQFKYTGATPGADANTYVLFTTAPIAGVVTQGAYPGARGLAGSGIETFVLDVSASEAGTVKAYKSQDRGVTWVQFIADLAHAGTTDTVSLKVSYDVAPLMEFRLDWVNGGVAQGTWLVDMAGSYDG